MKVASVITLTLLLAMAVLADQRHNRKLWVAIDDGTDDGGLFINLADDEVAANPAGPQKSDLGALQRVRAAIAVQADVFGIIDNETPNDTIEAKPATVLTESGHQGEADFVDEKTISSKEVNATN